MATAELRNERGDELRAERQRHIHAQQPGGLDPLRRNAGLGFLYLWEDALAGLQIVAAGLGQAQAAGAAVEQLDPEPGL